MLNKTKAQRSATGTPYLCVILALATAWGTFSRALTPFFLVRSLKSGKHSSLWGCIHSHLPCFRKIVTWTLNAHSVYYQ